MKFILSLSSIILLLMGCNKETQSIEFTIDQCVISPDGLIFKFAEVKDDSCIVKPWKGNSWGDNAIITRSMLEKNSYMSETCPEERKPNP